MTVKMREEKRNKNKERELEDRRKRRGEMIVKEREGKKRTKEIFRK